MNARTQETGIKRRSFFTSLIAGTAGVFAGIPLLRSIVRHLPASEQRTGKIVVTINPLAVPRSRKGGTSND